MFGDACYLVLIFFFNDTATTEIYTLSLHDALPISARFGLRRHCMPKERLFRRRGAVPDERFDSAQIEIRMVDPAHESEQRVSRLGPALLGRADLEGHDPVRNVADMMHGHQFAAGHHVDELQRLILAI